MADDTLDTKLWKPRSVSDTIAIYRDWAKSYDADILGSGYATPSRIAGALGDVAPKDAKILDFGCGTGLSGQALRDAGFRRIDGTDITPEMLEIAVERGIYDTTWLSKPDSFDVAQNAYDVICAAGVVSLGAAPPTMLNTLLSVLPSQGILAFSYNDPTLADQSYTNALVEVIHNNTATVLLREHGPHLPEKNMGSDIIVLQKT